MVGRVYLLRGEPVTVLARWAPPSDEGSGWCPVCGRILHVGAARGAYCMELGGQNAHAGEVKIHRQGPRNVLIRRGDGSLLVRPFRGLRRPA